MTEYVYATKALASMLQICAATSFMPCVCFFVVFFAVAAETSKNAPRSIQFIWGKGMLCANSVYVCVMCTFCTYVVCLESEIAHLQQQMPLFAQPKDAQNAFIVVLVAVGVFVMP